MANKKMSSDAALSRIFNIARGMVSPSYVAAEAKAKPKKKMMGGGKAARNSLGSSDIDGNNGNKYGNGTKIARHSLEGSNKKVVKSRRKSSLTPFAQRLLGTK